jgi:hypothetical protein
MQLDTSVRMKVFVSYARADLDFADQLVLALEDKNFEALLDRHDINVGEKWQERLSALLFSCDTVAFVLSKSSAASKICQWEVDEAVNLGKRIIPVLPEGLGRIAPPPHLAELNFVHFYRDPAIPGSGFYDGVQKLERALRVDLAWLRLQTKLGEFSAEWDRAKPGDKLLRGESLTEALAWLSKAPAGITVSEQIRNFLAASDKAENLRRAESQAQIVEREATLQKLSRRTTIGLAGAGVLSVAAGGLAYWGTNAERRFRESQALVKLAGEAARLKALESEAARMDIAGQITAYATSPGTSASDGEAGGNSPFTKAVTELLEDKDVSLLQALMKSSALVWQDSGTQKPFFATNLNGEIYLLRQPIERKRKALCMSVDSIKGSDMKLLNVERDARRWKDILERGGFEVKLLINPKKAEALAAIDSISKQPDLVAPHGEFQTPQQKLFIPAKISVVPSGDGGGSRKTDDVQTDDVPENVDPQKDEVMAAPDEFLKDQFAFIFYSGVGVSDLGEDYLAFNDSELRDKDITNTKSVLEIKYSLENRVGLSAVILDTNFTNGINVDRLAR